MLMSSQVGLLGDRLQLISPQANFTKPTLITFQYYLPLNLADTISSLELYLSPPLRTPQQLLFRVLSPSGTPVDTWFQGSACIPPGIFYLIFTATHGTPYVTDIAVDNIAIDVHPCVVSNSVYDNHANGILRDILVFYYKLIWQVIIIINAIRTQSTKDNTLFTALRQCWTVLRCAFFHRRLDVLPGTKSLKCWSALRLGDNTRFQSAPRRGGRSRPSLQYPNEWSLLVFKRMYMYMWQLVYKCMCIFIYLYVYMEIHLFIMCRLCIIIIIIIIMIIITIHNFKDLFTSVFLLPDFCESIYIYNVACGLRSNHVAVYTLLFTVTQTHHWNEGLNWRHLVLSVV